MWFTPHSLLLCVPSRVFNYVSTRHFDQNCHHNYGIRSGPFRLSELLICCYCYNLYYTLSHFELLEWIQGFQGVRFFFVTFLLIWFYEGKYGMYIKNVIWMRESTSNWHISQIYWKRVNLVENVKYVNIQIRQINYFPTSSSDRLPADGCHTWLRNNNITTKEWCVIEGVCTP